jgi:hypothetical protein
MLLNSNEYSVLPRNRRWYHMLLDMEGLLTNPMRLRHLVRLSMVNKEFQRALSFVLKRFSKQHWVFYPGSKSKLLLFDADGHYMTIRCIEDDIFRVGHAGVNYVVTQNLSSVHFASFSGYTYYPSESFGEVFRLLLQDLHVKKGVRRTSRRLGVPVKRPVAKIWFENTDNNTPHAPLGRLNLQVHVDFRHMHLMATARRWLHHRYGDYERDATGDGVQLCLWLQCVKFD